MLKYNLFFFILSEILNLLPPRPPPRWSGRVSLFNFLPPPFAILRTPPSKNGHFLERPCLELYPRVACNLLQVSYY